jgi:hypothetical protein
MASSSDCNAAWTKGYIEGYKSVKGTIPSVPSRPGSYPATTTDPIAYFYRSGYSAGLAKAGR